jgi:hypothetical protein
VYYSVVPKGQCLAGLTNPFRFYKMGQKRNGMGKAGLRLRLTFWSGRSIDLVDLQRE